MPLTLSDQDLAELNTDVMNDMRGKELRVLANWIQAKINRQLQQEAQKVAEPPKVSIPEASSLEGAPANGAVDPASGA